MANTTVACTNINLLKESQIPASPSQNELYAVEIPNPHCSLLDFKWTDHIINDMAWLRADTFSWQDGTVYSNAYQHLLNEWNTWWQSHTVGDLQFDGDLAFAVMPDGHRICGGIQSAVQEQEGYLTNLYNSKGVAWYYIIDTENRRFKLPRTKYGFTGLRDSVGNYVPESLPNISGKASSGFLWNAIIKSSGALEAKTNTMVSAGKAYADGSDPLREINIDASRSSSTYQNNAPVQQRATQMYLYFYVGEYSQSAIEQTAGITSEQLNQKLDLDAGNATSNTKETIVGWGMPDYDNKVEYNNAAPETFVADKDYYVCCKGDVLSYDIYKNGSAFLVEFLFSRGYNSVWAYLPKGTEIRRRSTSQYNNFVVVPLKGISNI